MSGTAIAERADLLPAASTATRFTGRPVRLDKTPGHDPNRAPLRNRTVDLLLTIYPRADAVAICDDAAQVRGSALCCRPTYMVITRGPRTPRPTGRHPGCSLPDRRSAVHPRPGKTGALQPGLPTCHRQPGRPPQPARPAPGNQPSALPHRQHRTSRQTRPAVLERALAEEMTVHLGYEKHDPAGRGSGNSRNGSTAKTVLTDVGAVDLAVPRDRAGSFKPQIVRKGQTRLEGFDDRIIALYAHGMSTRDIARTCARSMTPTSPRISGRPRSALPRGEEPAGLPWPEHRIRSSGWKQALQAFTIYFEGRIPTHGRHDHLHRRWTLPDPDRQHGGTAVW